MDVKAELVCLLTGLNHRGFKITSACIRRLIATQEQTFLLLHDPQTSRDAAYDSIGDITDGKIVQSKFLDNSFFICLMGCIVYVFQ